jgi:Serine hydrolase (FSH1)
MPFDLDSPPFTVGPDGTCRYAGTSDIIPSASISSTIPEASSAGYSGLWDSSTPFLWRYSKDTKNARIDVPSAHIYASNDSYYQQSRCLRELCLPQNLEVLEHRGGHDIPRDRNTTSKMVQCIQNMLHMVLVG